MATKIIPKKSSTLSKIPLSTDLEVGELAINLADQKIYTKNSSNTVIELGGSSGGLNDVVDDTTPTLGGNLDAAGNDINDVNSITTDSIQLLGGTGTQGTLTWNSDEETLDLVSDGTTLQLGQELFWNVKNQTGSTIPNGTPVMATGTVGSSGRITVAPMNGTSDSNTPYFLGITTEEILDGADGKVTHFGKVRDLDTSGYTEGTVLYVSPTVVGALTTTEPSAGQVKLPIAFVITSHANNGVIAVRVKNINVNAFQPYDSDTVVDANYVHTDNNYTTTEKNKLAGIEAGATGDQTAAEIRTLVEAATDSNVFTDADHSKLNGIEAGANVTDTANVTAAGALMDSEVTNLAQVKAFDSADYATAAQGTLADSALQAGDNISELTNDAGYVTTDTTYTAGTGLTLVGTEFRNAAPDQTVGITGGANVTVTGTYPNFTIASTDTNTQLSDKQVQDIVGAMFTGNTESGISVVYQDTDGTIDLNVNDPTITLSGDVSGSATMTNLGSVNISVTIADDSHNHTIANIDGLQTALNSKVDDSQVLTNVPAGAVFTYTVYTHPTSHPASIITTTDEFTYSNSSNVQDVLDDLDQAIANVNAKDPVLTLTGDATGSATFTNLGNATLNVSIADDSHNHTIANIDGLQTALDGKTTESYVNTQIANLVDTAPATMDTLNELAAALGDDPNFATTVSSQIGAKLDSSAYTASDVLTKVKTVDGSGSGLDADLLDGQHGAYYLDYTNFLNTPTIYTDAAVDTHLNTGTASSGEVLSWTGSDYDWVAVSGGATDIDGLSDAAASSSSIALGSGADFGAGSGSVAIGVNAKATRSGSVAIGEYAMAAQTSTDGVAIGNSAARNGVTGSTGGSRVVAVGTYAARNNNGSDNVAVGYYSLMGDFTSKLTGGYNIGIGRQTGYDLTSGSYNFLGGYFAGTNLTTGSYNVAIGQGTLGSATTGANNTAIGQGALGNATTSTSNIAIGEDAMGSGVITGGNNTAIGKQAGNDATSALGNVLIGTGAGDDITTGAYNVAIGQDALGFIATTTTDSIAIGREALRTGPNQAIALGYYAGRGSSTTRGVTIGHEAGSTGAGGGVKVGYRAGRNTPSGDNTVAIGYEALSNTSLSGVNNTAIGYQAGDSITTGANNIIIGSTADASSPTVSNEITLGNSSLTRFRIPGIQSGASDGDVLTYDATNGIMSLETPAAGATDIDGLSDGYAAGGSVGLGSGALANDDGTSNGNTAVGAVSGYSITNQKYSTFVGYGAGYYSLGSGVSAVGYLAGMNITDGVNSTALGREALKGNSTANLTGQNNVGVGYKAGAGLSTGYQNTLIGPFSGQALTTGSNNVVIGSSAGDTMSTGGNNIVLGSGSDPSSATVSNEITLGNSSITKLRVPGLSVEMTSKTISLNNWDITEDASGNLLFSKSGVNKMKLDANGNLQVVGDVESNATL